MKKKVNNEIEISLRLLKIQETLFFIDSSKISDISLFDSKKLSIEFGFKTDLNLEKELFILNTLVKYSYTLNDQAEKIVELETTNHFEIKNLKELVSIDENNGLKDHAGILPTLIGITIGSLRGILVVKTFGTPLSDFLLPIMNPMDILAPMNSSNKK